MTGGGGGGEGFRVRVWKKLLVSPSLVIFLVRYRFKGVPLRQCGIWVLLHFHIFFPLFDCLEKVGKELENKLSTH